MSQTTKQVSVMEITQHVIFTGFPNIPYTTGQNISLELMFPKFVTAKIAKILILLKTYFQQVLVT